MKKMYYLSTCSTCTAIIKKTGILSKGFQMQDIKTQNITAEDLALLKKLAGTYEALFSKRAVKYKEWGLKEKKLEEEDYRDLIVKEYTFLKRPVVIDGENIFIGNDQPTQLLLLKHLDSNENAERQ